VKLLRALSLAVLSILAASRVHSQADPAARALNQPVEPYRIIGNLYYVGASDVTSFLITTPSGHILLDGGFAETAPSIEANVKQLGFRIEDVRILINSHAHFDHAGGLAGLKAASGAMLAASAKEAPLLARGGKGDYLFGDTYSYPPVQTDRVLQDGDQVTVGGTTLTAHLTPGHTMGNTTWTMKVKEGKRTYDVVFAGSLSILAGVTLTNNAKYPDVGEDFARSFRVLKSLPCDVFLGPHASFYDGLEKARKLREGAKEDPFIDPQGYRSYLDTSEKKYQDQLQKERAASPARLANSGCALPNSECALPNSRNPLGRGGTDLARGGRALRGLRCALAEGLSPLANSRDPLAWRGPAPAGGTPESARAQPKFPRGGPALQGGGSDFG
jgi:metallo-beta-lactamase class B